MYIGHFMAWISASMLFAFQLHETHPDDYMVRLLRDHSAQYAAMTPEQIKALPISAELLRDAMQIENDLVQAGTITAAQKHDFVPTPIPGKLAYGACGIVGLLCVMFAGWTTATPTLSRAGLAFQAMVPRTSRFVVTLITGGIATVAGMFPWIAMQLLKFVAIYGMILMPMGAVIFVDFWLIRKFGLQSNYAEYSRTHFNWAAGLTWFLTLGACVFLNKCPGIELEIFFVSLPGWFVAAALYVVLSKLYQKNVQQGAVAKTA
jgi:purine-cytosine permease-like protein